MNTFPRHVAMVVPSISLTELGLGAADKQDEDLVEDGEPEAEDRE